MRLLLTVIAAGCAHGPSGGGGPVPAGVRATAERILGPSARIASERERGVTIYEAAAQTKLELELTDSGKLLKTELALPVATLPDAVASAVKGTIQEAEIVVMSTGVAFEVEVGDIEYTIDPSGKILAQEREPTDDED
jgi:hypothetical protein